MTDDSPEVAKRQRKVDAQRLAWYLDRNFLFNKAWPYHTGIDGFQPLAYCGTPKQSVESKA